MPRPHESRLSVSHLHGIRFAHVQEAAAITFFITQFICRRRLFCSRAQWVGKGHNIFHNAVQLKVFGCVDFCYAHRQKPL